MTPGNAKQCSILPHITTSVLINDDESGLHHDYEVWLEELDRALALGSHARESPIYHAPTDLCVVAPGGTFVAGCEALIDAHNALADVERICTHSRYRRRWALLLSDDLGDNL